MSLEKSVWERYADIYNTVANQEGDLIWLWNAHSSALKNQTVVLDSGCGPGHLAQRLLQDNHSVHALDISQAAIQNLQKRCGINPQLTTLVADACKTPYKDNTFDGVSSANVLWAVDSPTTYIHEQKRILKPDGILVISGPDHKVKSQLRKAIKTIAKHSHHHAEYLDSVTSHPQHHWRSREEMTALLTDSGFQIRKSECNPLYNGIGYLIVPKKPGVDHSKPTDRNIY